MKRKAQKFPLQASAPTRAPRPSLSASPSRVGHLLQLVNLHRHIVITQSPMSFTLGLPPGAVHSVGLDKCWMAWFYHCGIVQCVFTVPQNPPDSSLSCNPWYFYCLLSIAFSRTPLSWSLRIHSLFRLPSLSNTYFGFLHVFHDSLFLFDAE